MWDIRPRRVLVAVETAECDAALAYAAREARQRKVGVHLVHVVPMVAAVGAGVDAIAVVNGDLHDVGRKILGDTATKLERLLGDDPLGADLPVSTELCHGPVVPTLVDLGEHACLVVLQHRGMGPDGRSPVLSVTHAVAARSHVPVVAVPAGWRDAATDDVPVAPVVTVGVGAGQADTALVEIAAAAASRRGAGLGVIRAGDESALAEETVLVVVGRRSPRLRLGHHLGPLARTLLRRSPVPVMVVDQDGPDTEEGRDRATAAVS